MRLKRWLVRLFKLKIRKERIFGLTVHLLNYKTFTSLFRQMFITKEYFFTSETSHPFIIDCGSNIGMSVLFFKQLYPESRILAFEPDSDTFEVLKKNVEDNDLHEIEVFNKAVSDREGSVRFYSNPSSPGSLSMSTYRNRHAGKESVVETVELSPYITKQVDFLKMDIEGSEGRVIEELAKQDKLKLIKEMVLEYHHHIEPKDDTLSRILDILENNGFGYQLRSHLNVPFKREEFQDILIYAYQK